MVIHRFDCSWWRWNNQTDCTETHRSLLSTSSRNVYYRLRCRYFTLQNLLSLAASNPSTVADPCLFPSFDSSSHWDTKRLSNILTRAAKPYLGNIKLTVSSYRQISIAIRKKLVDTQSQTVTSVGALQTCHSEETERQLYALTTSGLRSLGAESFEEFRSANTAWLS